MKRAVITVGLGSGDEGKGAAVDFLTRELGADLVVRYCGGCHHFGVHRSGVGSGSSGFRYGVGLNSGAENTLGRTRSAGHLDRRNRHALAAARQVRQPRIFHSRTASRIG